MGTAVRRTPLALGALLATVSSALLLTRPDFLVLVSSLALGSFATALLALFGLSALASAGGWLVARSRGDTLERNGAAAVMIVALALAAFTAWQERAAFSTRALAFESAGTRLVGTLYVPRGRGPYPALVLVHGSGDFPRRIYGELAASVARLRWVVLNYEKRGVGASAGEYEGRNNTSPENVIRLAGDAAAAVEALGRLPEVRRDRIGLYGVSQGGWVGVVAAAQSPRVAFMLLVSGPTVSTGEEGAFSELAGDEADHFGRRDPPMPLDEIERRMEQVTPSGFDPLPYLERINAPALWLFGEWDNSIPVRRSVARLDALRASGKPFEYRVFEQANHGLMIARGPRKGLLPYFAPGVGDATVAWLRRMASDTAYRYGSGMEK